MSGTFTDNIKSRVFKWNLKSQRIFFSGEEFLKKSLVFLLLGDFQVLHSWWKIQFLCHLFIGVHSNCPHVRSTTLVFGHLTIFQLSKTREKSQLLRQIDRIFYLLWTVYEWFWFSNHCDMSSSTSDLGVFSSSTGFKQSKFSSSSLLFIVLIWGPLKISLALCSQLIQKIDLFLMRIQLLLNNNRRFLILLQLEF